MYDTSAVVLIEVVEPVMPATLALPALFNIRPVSMVTEDEDDRLSNIYWLSTPMGDESDHEQDLVGSSFFSSSVV